MSKKKPLVVVTRKLPAVVETRMRELFDARLNLDDTPMSQAALVEAQAGRLDALVAFQQWGPMAPLAHPTHEHYLPLLYAAGAALPTEMPRFFNTGFQSASISMRSMLWG